MKKGTPENSTGTGLSEELGPDWDRGSRDLDKLDKHDFTMDLDTSRFQLTVAYCTDALDQEPARFFFAIRYPQ